MYDFSITSDTNFVENWNGPNTEKNIDAAELDEDRSTLGVVEADWTLEPETNDTSMKNWQTLSIWKDEIGKEEYMPTDEVNCY